MDYPSLKSFGELTLEYAPQGTIWFELFACRNSANSPDPSIDPFASSVDPIDPADLLGLQPVHLPSQEIDEIFIDDFLGGISEGCPDNNYGPHEIGMTKIDGKDICKHCGKDLE